VPITEEVESLFSQESMQKYNIFLFNAKNKRDEKVLSLASLVFDLLTSKRTKDGGNNLRTHLSKEFFLFRIRGSPDKFAKYLEIKEAAAARKGQINHAKIPLCQYDWKYSVADAKVMVSGVKQFYETPIEDLNFDAVKAFCETLLPEKQKDREEKEKTPIQKLRAIRNAMKTLSEFEIGEATQFDITANGDVENFSFHIAEDYLDTISDLREEAGIGNEDYNPIE
jgi:hypothetical protein